MAIASHAGWRKILVGMGLLGCGGGCQARSDGEVHAFQEKASGEDEASRVTYHHQTATRELWQHRPATLRDHVCRILQGHAITHERSNSGMALELVE